MPASRIKARRTASTPIRTMLITAGPTFEPIDRVRYIGNRSSGRVGIELADAADAAGWRVTLLLGPTHLLPARAGVRVVRFTSCQDLQKLLKLHAGKADAVVMAAAVADYTPVLGDEVDAADGKLRRNKSGMTLRLVPTPDLLAGVSRSRTSGQVLVGFALEPRSRLIASARDKLARKGVDLVVANPLETMDSPTIQATLVAASGVIWSSRRAMDKGAFARKLVSVIGAMTPRD